MSWVAVAIGGSALLASQSAKKANKQQDRANDTAGVQAQISQDLFNQSDPLRQMLIDRSTNFLGPTGLGDMMSSPAYLAFKGQTDGNFAKAKDNTLASLPNGGGLMDALTGLEGQRASTLSQGAGQIYDNETARALSLATGQVPTAMSGLGQAANAQSMNAASASASSDAKAGSLGQGVGAYLGSK